MLKIHKETDYALIAMNYFAQTDDYVPLSRLVEDTNMPQRFLARITAQLTSAGLLKSKEGRSGGYKLSKSLEDITLYEFLNIFERGLHIVSCENPGYECACNDACKHKHFLSETLRTKILTQLDNISVADVFEK